MASLLKSLTLLARPLLKTNLPVLSACTISSSYPVANSSSSLTPSQPQTIENIAAKYKRIYVNNHAPVTEDMLHSITTDRAYYELPVIHMLAAKNNTQVHLTDCNGRSLCLTSCGIEGFKNARKQTTIACQATGIALGLRAKKLGLTAARVIIKGVGRGRLPTLQGFAMSGLTVVSITDNTPIHYGLGRRPPVVPRK